MVKSLTKKTKDGKVYTRRKEVETEIKAALKLSEDEIITKAEIIDHTASDYMSSECIVHLIKKDVSSKRRELVNNLTPILLKRCEKNINKHVLGFDKYTMEDIQGDIYRQLLEKILVEKGNGDYLEVNFNHAFECLRISISCNHRQYAQDNPEKDVFDEEGSRIINDGNFGIDVETSEWDKTEKDESCSIKRTFISLSENDPSIEEEISNNAPKPISVEQLIDIKEILLKLSDEERELFILNKVVGIQAKSEKDEVKSLDKIFGVHEKTIRNRLGKIENKIKKMREDKK